LCACAMVPDISDFDMQRCPARIERLGGKRIDEVKQRMEAGMRFSDWTIAVASAAFLAAGAASAADLKIRPRAAPDISVHTGPPNCSRWTDGCVNCSRDVAGDAPVCSNIGFACQPKPVRCLGGAIPQRGPRQK
jgi:hypothetical protein